MGIFTIQPLILFALFQNCGRPNARLDPLKLKILPHSNPLNFLKGVESVTARPPPLHENCAHNDGGPIE